MKEEWFIVRHGPGSPSWNMAFDEALLEFAQQLAGPVLRLYSWNLPAATFGYSQRYAEVASWTTLRPLIRRPTGGGLVPHDRDWTYSLVFPPQHPWYELRAEESYRRAHEWISESLRQMKVAAALAPSALKDVPGQCFIGAEKFDVLASGRKVAGAAQKRNKLGLLIQGSLQPESGWERIRWEESLLNSAAARWNIQWMPLNPPEGLLNRTELLDQQKYATSAHNARR